MQSNGATAVIATSPHEFLVSIKGKGIFSFQNNSWKLLIPLKESIYQLKRVGEYIMGVGERGRFIQLHATTGRWRASFFPTTQKLWNIVGNDNGMVITHGGSQLLVSYDYGQKWHVVAPFKERSAKPIIRSLALHGEALYIGTQIHKQHGGLWKYSLSVHRLERLFYEISKMISSIHVDHSSLWMTTGACQTKKGAILFYHPGEKQWGSITPQLEERAFLSIIPSEDSIYFCSSKDEFGYSRIYHCNVIQKQLTLVETIKGHCFCGAYREGELFLAGAEECKWLQGEAKEKQILH